MTLDVPDTLDRMPLQRCSAAKSPQVGRRLKGIGSLFGPYGENPLPLTAPLQISEENGL